MRETVSQIDLVVFRNGVGVAAGVQLVECLPSMYKVCSPPLHQLDVVIGTCSASSQEAETRVLDIQSELGLHLEDKASLYWMKPHLKNIYF